VNHIQTALDRNLQGLGSYGVHALAYAEKIQGVVVVLGYPGRCYRMPEGVADNNAFAFMWKSPFAHYTVGAGGAISSSDSDRSRVTLPAFPGAASVPGLQFDPCRTGGLLVQVASSETAEDVSLLDLLTLAAPLVTALLHRESLDFNRRLVIAAWGQFWQLGETQVQLLIPLSPSMLLAAPMAPGPCAAFDSFKSAHAGRFLWDSLQLKYLSSLILDRSTAPQCKKALDMALSLF